MAIADGGISTNDDDASNEGLCGCLAYFVDWVSIWWFCCLVRKSTAGGKELGRREIVLRGYQFAE